MLPSKIDVLGKTYSVTQGVNIKEVPNSIHISSTDTDAQLEELIGKIFDSVIRDLEMELPLTEKDLRLIKKGVAGVFVKNVHNIDWVVSSRLERAKQDDSAPVSTTFANIGNGIRLIKRTGI